MSFGSYETSYGYPSVDASPLLPKEESIADGNISYVRETQDQEDFEKSLKEFDIVIVDVWANFCSPCKMITPMYENLAAKFYANIMKKQVCFLKDCIDHDTKDSIHGNQITAVPTFFIYVKGEMVASIVGGDINRLDKIINTLTTSQNVTVLEPNYAEKLAYLQETGIIDQQSSHVGKMNQTHHGVY